MYHGLQFLRFLCAASVVMLHAAEAVSLRTGSGWHLNSIASRLGVETFFVISGFVMIMVTPATADQLASRVKTAGHFLLRRVIRVAPMYWIYSALKVVMVLLIPALALRSSIDWRHVFLSFVFVPAMSPWGQMQPILPVGWTLNFEFLFYVIFAVTIISTHKRALIASAILLGIFLVGSQATDANSVLHFYGRSLLLDFALGMGIARLTQKEVSLPAIVSWGILTIAAVGCAVDLNGFVSSVEPFGFGVMSALILWSTISLERSFLHRLKFLNVLGDASYSIYLSHSFSTPAAVILIAKLGAFGPIFTTIGATLISCIVGCVAYKLIEKPLTNHLRKRFDPRPHSASA